MTQTDIDRIRAYCEKATPGFQEMASACYDLRLLLQHVEQLRQQVASYEVYEVKSHNEANDAAKDWCKILGIERDDWGYWKDFTPHIDQLRKERDELTCAIRRNADRLKHWLASDSKGSSLGEILKDLQAALHPTSKPA